MITKNQIKNFKPTKDQLSACECVLVAMAFCDTIRPIVIKYQSDIIADMKPKISKKLRDTTLNEVITSPNQSYLMNNEDFALYLKRCNEQRIIAGLHVDKVEFCPLLVAEHNIVKAQWALCDSMEAITKLSHDDIFQSKNALENYRKYIDLCLKLLVPFLADNIAQKYQVA